MAYTNLYVTATAGGSGDGSEGDPFTLAQALADTTASAIYWIKSGSYSVASAAAVSTAGTSAAMRLYKGYNTTIGDLDNQGRSSDGSLNTTNFPVLTLTDSLSIPSYIFFMNCDISGSLAGDMLGNSASDRFGFINCKLTNTGEGTSATVIRGDDQVTVINSDLYSGTGTYYSLIRSDYYGVVYGCRLIDRGAATRAILGMSVPTAIKNFFIGNGSAAMDATTTVTESARLIDNTFYNCGTVLNLPNAAITNLPYFINNHLTDSTGIINNLYSGTADVAIVEVNNRTRDNTTPRTGVGDGILLNEVTTDTGGPETDYVNHTTGDLKLKSTAVGIDAGLGFGVWNIGASQNEYSSGGGGGIIKVGLSGGIE